MPKAPNQRKAYNAHFARVERYAALVDAIYDQATKEAVKMALTAGHDPSKPFQFANYPQTKTKADELLRGVTTSIRGVIVNGATAEWDESNFKNDALARSIIGVKTVKDMPAHFKPYFSNNSDALKAFIGRKTDELGLSEKVWKLSEQYKSDLELALSIGISDGRSAAELSRDIRQYLNEPKKLFRRVMQNDKLRLSDAAKAYHPGQGVYRSSYKNAMRLTRTEINAAYRTADSARWSQMDFVVGFEVKRSERGYSCSVCEALAGKYPKGFVFTGWHPHCRCYVIPILKTDDEFWQWDGRGQAPIDSINTVSNVPQGFTDWVDINSSRITQAQQNGTLPYFLKDNGKYQNKIANYIDDAKMLHHFRTDIDAIENSIYWDYAKQKGLTHAQAFLINNYTNKYYLEINNKLRARRKPSKMDMQCEQLINTGLQKLDIYNGLCYRGTYLKDLDIQKYVDALKNRTVLIENAFTSSSLKIDVAANFMCNVFFTIKSNIGRQIKDLSFYGFDEAEILFKSKAKFVVKRIDEEILDGVKEFKITIEEV